jgi:hypothetical protein
MYFTTFAGKGGYRRTVGTDFPGREVVNPVNVGGCAERPAGCAE